MTIDFSAFEKAHAVDMDLSVTAIVYGREAFLTRNQCLPNAVLYAVGNHAVESLAQALLRDYGIRLAFVECPDLTPRDAWRLLRIGATDTVMLGSNGA